jgi:hypothetical protein
VNRGVGLSSVLLTGIWSSLAIGRGREPVVVKVNNDHSARSLPDVSASGED